MSDPSLKKDEEVRYYEWIREVFKASTVEEANRLLKDSAIELIKIDSEKLVQTSGSQLLETANIVFILGRSSRKAGTPIAPPTPTEKPSSKPSIPNIV